MEKPLRERYSLPCLIIEFHCSYTSDSVNAKNVILISFLWTKVTIRPRDGKKVEHNGIKIEFVGSIGR